MINFAQNDTIKDDGYSNDKNVRVASSYNMDNGNGVTYTSNTIRSYSKKDDNLANRIVQEIKNDVQNNGSEWGTSKRVEVIGG